jgi:hypothetical protein
MNWVEGLYVGFGIGLLVVTVLRQKGDLVKSYWANERLGKIIMDRNDEIKFIINLGRKR